MERCDCEFCGSGLCRCGHLVGVHNNGACLYAQCECKQVEKLTKENKN